MSPLTKDVVQNVINNHRTLVEKAKLLAAEYCKNKDISYDSISIRGIDLKEIVFDVNSHGKYPDSRIHNTILGIPTSTLYDTN
jgi:hypothetical protein